jgi:hypothetical protein
VDTLGFRIATSAGYSFEVADVFINGRRLVDLVREVEQPFAEQEGHPDLAGGYEGIDADLAFLPSQHLLGGAEPKRGVAILECGTCSIDGCWPLTATITLEGETVIWSDFEQPHRSSRKPPVWSYEKLGPFVFDRTQYEAALAHRPSA